MKQYPEFLAAAFAVLDQAVLIIDGRSRTIMDLNPAAERLLGESAPSIRGIPVDEIVRFVHGRQSGEPHGTGQTYEYHSNIILSRRGTTPPPQAWPLTCSIVPFDGEDGATGEIMVLSPVADTTAAHWDRLVSQSDTQLACIVDAEGCLRRVSRGLAELLGYSMDDLIGQDVRDFLHPDDRPHTRQDWLARLQSGADCMGIENRFRCKSGGYRYLSWYAIADPVTRIIYGVASDITERKRQERLLRETESGAGIGGWEIDLATNTLYWTSETYRIHDTSPEEYTPTVVSAFACCSEESRPRISAAMQRAIEHGEPYDLDIELVTAKGRRIACRAIGRADIEAGEVARIYGSVQDITEQYRVQQALRDSEERLRSLVRDMTMGLVVQSPAGEIVMSNQAALDILGLTEEQILGKTSFDEDWYAIHEDGSPFPGETHPTMVALRTGQSITGVIMGVYRPRTKDRVWILINAVVQRDNGHISRVVCSFIDITDRKRAEDAARESHAMFRAVYDNAGLGVLLRGPQGTLIECNPTFERMLGYSSNELRAMDGVEVVHADDRDVPADLHAALLAGRRDFYAFERRFIRADGGLLWGHVTVSLVRETDGSPRYIVEMIMDISDRKQMETQLLLADRLSSLGTMAAGVSHEINNPLTWIMGNISFSLDLMDEVQDNEGQDGIEPEALDDMRAALSEAMAGAERVRTIVRDLKRFSRMEDTPGAVAAPNQVIESTARMLSNEINHRARFELDLGDVPLVVGDEARIGQVLTNLLINAVQALPDRSRDQNFIQVRSRLDGQNVVLEVSDNGAGIPPAVQSRIFDPFFTTKDVGVGTGLGLSICHSIVTRLGGRMEVDSKPGRGTTFRVWLVAVSTDEAAPAEHDDAMVDSLAPRKRILCIDDEPDVGRLITRILSKRHEVVVETDSAQALQRLRAGERYDAIICDLMMPSMSGMEFYKQLQVSKPDLARRCGFITGGVFTPAARAFAASLPPTHLVEKPFRGHAIKELVGNLIS